MNLQAAPINAIIPTAGPVVVHYRGSNPPMDSIYLDGVEVARVREEGLPQGGSFFVALDLDECETRGFSVERDSWAAAVEWLLRRQLCSNAQIAKAILDYEAAEATFEMEACDARR